MPVMVVVVVWLVPMMRAPPPRPVWLVLLVSVEPVRLRVPMMVTPGL